MDHICSRWDDVEAVLWILKFFMQVRIRIPELRIWIEEANKLRIRPDSDPTWTFRGRWKNISTVPYPGNKPLKNGKYSK
jgi:hypothetical protein